MELVAVDAPDEALLLDLLNTTPVVDGVPRDDLADPKAARAWMRERGIAPTKVELAALLDARSVLQKVVRGEARPAALQRFLGAARLRPVCRLRGAGLATGGGRRSQGRGARGAGMGRRADLGPGPAAPVCEHRMPAVPDRPLQAQHREVVLDGDLWQPDEGAQALPPRPHGAEWPVKLARPQRIFDVANHLSTHLTGYVRLRLTWRCH